MKNKTNDWGLTYNMDYPSARRGRLYEKESFAVKLCPNCNAVYETIFNQYKRKYKAYYYEDFPRIGLYHKACNRCEKENE